MGLWNIYMGQMQIEDMTLGLLFGPLPDICAPKTLLSCRRGDIVK